MVWVCGGGVGVGGCVCVCVGWVCVWWGVCVCVCVVWVVRGVVLGFGGVGGGGLGTFCVVFPEHVSPRFEL